MRAREGRARLAPSSAALAALLALAGCRSCKDEAAGTQPPMPSGMLVPAPGPAGSSEPLAVRLRGASAPRAGWFQVTVARDGGAANAAEGRWISPSAMTIMEGAFGQAQPGFTPYGKRDVAPENVAALAKELRELRKAWLATPSPAHARAKYGALVVSEGEKDDAWPNAKEAFGATLEDLAAYCDAQGKRGDGVVVLGGS